MVRYEGTNAMEALMGVLELLTGAVWVGMGVQ